jgi:hypothetical protein
VGRDILKNESGAVPWLTLIVIEDVGESSMSVSRSHGKAIWLVCIRFVRTIASFLGECERKMNRNNLPVMRYRWQVHITTAIHIVHGLRETLKCIQSAACG